MRHKSVNFCNNILKNPKVFKKNADIYHVNQNKIVYPGKDKKMHIENEMLKRFSTFTRENSSEISISNELDYFFDNVMDTVVDFFTEKEELKV